MTDAEIIKTLELLEFCKSMARHGEDVLLTPDTIFGIDKIIKSKDKQLEVVKLMHINDVKQKDAEIKRLKAEAEMTEGYAEALEQKARKEFADRLKAQKITHHNLGELVYVEDIDNLLAEMEGETE